MKNKTEKITALVTGILAILIWSGVFTQAQPRPAILDCCQQAITFKNELDAMTLKYNQSVDLLGQTRDAGNDLLREKDERIKRAQDEANTKLTGAAGRETVLKQNLTLSTTRLNLAKAELQTELIKGRFLGFGRRRFIRQLLTQLN